jgi:toxin ParE1/3/4
VPRYILSPEAKEDLREIREYLVSQGGRRLARYVLQEIRAAFRLLASRPEAGHLRQDLTPLPVKFWPVFSYLIVYDPAARPLAIVRVLHGRRDVEAILDQRSV